MGINIKGLADLQSKLDRLNEKVQKVIVKQALKETVTEILLPVVKQNVPVDSGALLEGLQVKAISRRGIIGAAVVDQAVSGEFHGSYVELGTKNEAPQKFMRNALDDHETEILQDAGDRLGKAIEQAAKS